MDKKILLSGAAALIMGFGVYAAPASAAISFSYEGEASITADMSDACSVFSGDLADSADVSVALINSDADHTGTDLVEDDAGTAGVTETQSTDNLDDTLNGVTACGTGVTEDNPVWGVASTWDWTASGTLANGLGLDLASDEVAVSGAFGKFTFAKSGDSAVKAARTNTDGNIDVTGNTLGGHTAKTSGTAGVGFLWAAPAVGGVDLFVSYSPNAADSGKAGVADALEDTLGLGLKFTTDMLTISAGFENTSGAAACATQAKATSNVLDAKAANATLKDYANQVLVNGCGDEQLTALGASMSAGGLDLNVGWSELDTDGGDKTVMNIGASTSLGDYTVGVDYVDAEQTYLFTAAADEQTVIGVNLATNLGEGVDLKLQFSSNDYNIAGTGSHSNYFAQAKLDIAY
jgi:uncharacterized protein YaiE (UPF0345 family)